MYLSARCHVVNSRLLLYIDIHVNIFPFLVCPCLCVCLKNQGKPLNPLKAPDPPKLRQPRSTPTELYKPSPKFPLPAPSNKSPETQADIAVIHGHIHSLLHPQSTPPTLAAEQQKQQHTTTSSKPPSTNRAASSKVLSTTKPPKGSASEKKSNKLRAK